MRICYVGAADSIHVRRWAAFFVERGHRVSLISDIEETIPGVDVHYIGSGLLPFRIPALSAIIQILIKAIRIRGLIRRIKPDLLHGHYATNYGFLAALSGFRPLVQTVHGSDALVDAEGSFERRCFVRYALRKATFITAVTAQIARRVEDMGISRERILIHQYGVDTRVFYPPTDPSIRRSSHLVSVRMFEWKYNIQHLLRALPLVRSRIPDIEVTLAGDGPDRPALETLVDELDLRSAVTFIGRVGHERMPDLLRSATVYVSTSVTEGTSLSLLEAMGCGAFPVVTDIPGNREWVTDGENGCLVPVNDVDALAGRLVEAFEQSAFREEAVRRNMELVRTKADYTTSMRRIEAVYERLIRDGA